MELKKNPKYDVRRQSSTFFLIGLLVALTLTLAAFSYTSRKEEAVEQVNYTPADEVEELADITRQDEPPPSAPPPPPPTTVEVIPDEIETPKDELPEPDQNKDQHPTENQKPAEELQPEQTGEQEIFNNVEEPPSFAGGEAAMNRFIISNLLYPPSAVERGLSGTINVQFVVELNGRVSEVKAVDFFDEECAKEAVRVVRMMRWNPGKQHNKPVRTRMIIPIAFRLR